MRTSVGHRDANEAAIVAELRKHGCSVSLLSADGVPDLLVGIGGLRDKDGNALVDGRTVLMEIKRPPAQSWRRGARGWVKNGRGGGRLRASQAAWIRQWTGGPVHVVSTPGEALEAVGLKRRGSCESGSTA